MWHIIIWKVGSLCFLEIFIFFSLFIIIIFQESLKPNEDLKGAITQTAFFKHHQFFNLNVNLRQELKAT